MARETWLSRMGANLKLSHLPNISSRVLVVDPLEDLESTLVEVASSAERVGGEMAAGGAIVLMDADDVDLGLFVRLLQPKEGGRKKHDPLASIIQIEFRAV
jgi:hypothetical protein